MMKILIKRSKKDVLSQSKEYHTKEVRHHDASQKQLLFTSEHLYGTSTCIIYRIQRVYIKVFIYPASGTSDSSGEDSGENFDSEPSS